MEITYESIKSLIRKEELVNGNQINLEFCAKNQQTPFATVAVIMPDQAEMNKNIAKEVGKSVAKSTVIGLISRAVGSIFGGIGGSVASSATSMAGSHLANRNSGGAILNTNVTPEKKEKAIVDAFKNLQTIYQFNEQTSEWEYKI